MIRTNLTEMFQRPLKLSADAKAWKLVASGAAILLSAAAILTSAQGQTQYPPLSEYMMPQDAEIALARSAAPANVSDRATIKVLNESGFEVAIEGDNGFVCMVMRAWSAPTYTPAAFLDFVYYAPLRAPICFNPVAAETMMRYYELRTELGLQGKNPDEIADGIEAAYAKGELPRIETVSFAYMWSADQDLGPGIGHWHPHMMVFTPYYENSMLGGNEFGGTLPFVSDDAGTPFAVTLIPTDDGLARSAAR
ncbi:MAG: hypothetical protein ACRD47_02510 [Nitrososphaeraceae archaeon]